MRMQGLRESGRLLSGVVAVGLCLTLQGCGAGGMQTGGTGGIDTSTGGSLGAAPTVSAASMHETVAPTPSVSLINPHTVTYIDIVKDATTGGQDDAVFSVDLVHHGAIAGFGSYNKDGSGKLVGASSNGFTFTVTSQLAGSGSVAISGVFTNSRTGQIVNVSAIHNSNGSNSNQQITTTQGHPGGEGDHHGPVAVFAEGEDGGFGAGAFGYNGSNQALSVFANVNGEGHGAIRGAFAAVANNKVTGTTPFAASLTEPASPSPHHHHDSPVRLDTTITSTDPLFTFLPGSTTATSGDFGSFFLTFFGPDPLSNFVFGSSFGTSVDMFAQSGAIAGGGAADPVFRH